MTSKEVPLGGHLQTIFNHRRLDSYGYPQPLCPFGEGPNHQPRPPIIRQIYPSQHGARPSHGLAQDVRPQDGLRRGERVCGRLGSSRGVRELGA